MSSDLEILHDFLKNPISLDLDKLKYGRDSASLTTDSGREIKLPIFDANDIFQKVRFNFFHGIIRTSFDFYKILIFKGTRPVTLHHRKDLVV